MQKKLSSGNKNMKKLFMVKCTEGNFFSSVFDSKNEVMSSYAMDAPRLLFLLTIRKVRTYLNFWS